MSAVEEESVASRGTTRNKSSTHSGMQIGQLLLRQGKLSEEDIRHVVVAQLKHAVRFGEAALSLGLVNESDLTRALSTQYEYSYLRIGESNLSTELVAAYQPFGMQAEALRSLRTMLTLRWFNDRAKTLAIVAPRSGDGCSVIAANLAILFAQLGKLTLLIDGNFRRPRQHTLFDLRPVTGLSNLLAGRVSLKEASIPIEPFDNLWVLCTGSSPPNPQELLGRVSFSRLLQTAAASYDVVIMDAPPFMEYADAQIIAARAGGCLLLARRHLTAVVDIEKIKARLQPTGTTLLGAVICG